ncbi:MAG: hypothetical protein KQI35_03590 [Bacteroidetes bacterium]|nr:hypothetical protein [Bacteroidota bacterium]
MLDFTYKKYNQIVESISRSGYQVLTIGDYIKMGAEKPEKFIIIRHDVDLDADYQVKFAELENRFGIHTSYYFRCTDKIYKEDTISKVHKLGHEVGYHYEVITKAKGDPVKAIDIFKDEIDRFQTNWKSETICPHGGSFVDNADGYALKDIIKLIPKLLSKKSVFSNWSNFNLWEKHDYKEFGIIGDAYESVDFKDILYLSDTGRSWDSKYKRLDKVDSLINPKFNVKKSNDIIKIIENGEANKIYLLVHLEQWKDNLWDWFLWYVAQVIRRSGKKFIFKMKGK